RMCPCCRPCCDWRWRRIGRVADRADDLLSSKIVKPRAAFRVLACALRATLDLADCFGHHGKMPWCGESSDIARDGHYGPASAERWRVSDGSPTGFVGASGAQSTETIRGILRGVHLDK